MQSHSLTIPASRSPDTKFWSSFFCTWLEANTTLQNNTPSFNATITKCTPSGMQLHGVELLQERSTFVTQMVISRIWGHTLANLELSWKCNALLLWQWKNLNRVNNSQISIVPRQVTVGTSGHHHHQSFILGSFLAYQVTSRIESAYGDHLANALV